MCMNAQCSGHATGENAQNCGTLLYIASTATPPPPIGDINGRINYLP